MKEQYLKMIMDFKKLDIEDKKEEVYKNTLELLNLLYFVNKKTDEYNKALPIIKKYDDEDEYFNALYTLIISLKEENAKVVEKFI